MVRIRVQLLLNLIDDTFEEDLALDDNRLTTSAPLLLMIGDHARVHARHLIVTKTGLTLRPHVLSLQRQGSLSLLVVHLLTGCPYRVHRNPIAAALILGVVGLLCLIERRSIETLTLGLQLLLE